MPDKMAGVTGRDSMAKRRESLASDDDISEPFRRLERSLATAPTVLSTTEVICRPPMEKGARQLWCSALGLTLRERRTRDWRHESARWREHASGMPTRVQ